MCAIVGCHLEAPTPLQIQTLERLFIESQIRGKHATGYSLIQGNKVITRKEALPAETFINSHFAEVEPGEYILQLAGHCRYSTSDLQYNQPIQVFDDLALAHNGVVTQEPPGMWHRYGYELQTANDSELLYQARHAGHEPLVEFPTATMAVCELSVADGLRWYRNGGRPLYHVKVANGYFICSTKDIAERAGLKGARRCKPGTIYTPTGTTKLTRTKELIP